jgi:hypothetical protein
MANLSGVVRQLRKERERAQRHVERIDAAITALAGLNSDQPAKAVGRRMSAAARRRIAAAQRARWAKIKKAA